MTAATKTRSRGEKTAARRTGAARQSVKPRPDPASPAPVQPPRPAPASPPENPVCDFGRHAGETYDRIPESYLNWMIRARHAKAPLATAELERRTAGPSAPPAQAPPAPVASPAEPAVRPALTIVVSGEAVDALSKHCLHIWDENRFTAEGLYTWARREGRAAIDRNQTDPQGRYRHLGVIWTFTEDGDRRTLKTAAPEVRRSMVDWNAKVRAGAATHRRAVEAGRGKL